MSANMEGKKRTKNGEVVSYVMEAMPNPTAWGVVPPNAKGKGCLKLAKGRIAFVRLNIKMDKEQANPFNLSEEEIKRQERLLMEMDPADRRAKKNGGRRSLKGAGSQSDNAAAFSLGSRIRRQLGDKSKDKPSPYAGVDYYNGDNIKKITDRLNDKARKLIFNLVELGVVAVFVIALELLPAFGVSLPDVFLPEKFPAVYLLLELFALGFAVYTLCEDVLHGLRDLFRMRFNVCSVIAAAVLAETLHIIYMLADFAIFGDIATNSFVPPICLGMWVYMFSKFLELLRVGRGFDFVIKSGVRSVVMSADDDETLSRFVSPHTAYAVRADRLSAYFDHAMSKNSFGEIMPRIYFCFFIISAVTGIIGLVRGIASGGDFIGMALSAFCASLVVIMPITGLLCMEIPIERTVCRLLGGQTLLNGWDSVNALGATEALALNTGDIFPSGSVRVRRAITVSSISVQELTATAASILVPAGGALGAAFGDLVSNEKIFIGNADRIEYENGRGIYGRSRDRRIMAGNRRMMEEHRVIVHDGGLARLKEFEKMKTRKGHRVLYVAVNNRLEGVFLLEYRVANAVRSALVNLISDGTNVMIYTCDANVTREFTAELFDIPSEYVSIMDNDSSVAYDAATCAVHSDEEATLVTDGSLKSIADGIRAAVSLRESRRLGTILQHICFALGFLFVAGLSCINSYAIDAAQIIIMQLVFVLISLIFTIRSI